MNIYTYIHGPYYIDTPAPFAATAAAAASAMYIYIYTRTSLADSAQFDEILKAPDSEAPPPPPIELTGPEYVKTLPGASAPFPYFDPLEISSKVGVLLFLHVHVHVSNIIV